LIGLMPVNASFAKGSGNFVVGAPSSLNLRTIRWFILLISTISLLPVQLPANGESVSAAATTR
jgi:hypothetical protein